MSSTALRRPWRRYAAGTVATVIASALIAGCGSGDESTGAGDAPTADASAFPVTIQSALGPATIEEKPERVATWGWSTQDAVLALGVVPVAMPRYTYGGDDEGVLPWVADALDELGAETPELLDGGDTSEVPFEQFAAADPDVILAPYSGMTQDEFDKLSKIAPVVAYPDEPWATSWQDQLETVGRALGLADEAAALREKVDTEVAELGAQHDVLEGKTFFYAAANDPGVLNVYRADDPRVQLLEQLGLTRSPSVEELDAKPDEGTHFYPLSYENVSEVEADVLVAYFGDQKAADAFVADPVIARMAPVKAGNFAPIVGESFVMASSAPTALAIPWMLEEYVPQLAKAVG